MIDPPFVHGQRRALSLARLEARTGRALSGLARRRIVALLLVTATSFFFSWRAVIRTDATAPAVHDEFSYLLAADTYRHGRLTNPTPAMWEHFETIHVLLRPTYASKYPPLQGASLAVGQLLFGKPMAGVWVTLALAAVVTWWALRAWVPPVWALAGGLLAASHPLGVLWAHIYFGGGVAYLGGGLVLGAMRRVTRARVARVRRRDAALLALGALVLANSRPYEGLVLMLGVGATLVWWMARTLKRDRTAAPHIATRVIGPALAVLALGGAAMLYVNARVTGDPFKMPYTVYEEQYGAAPLFVWQSPRPAPAYRHREIERLQVGWALGEMYGRQRTPGTARPFVEWKARYYFRGFITPTVLLAPLLCSLLVLRRNPWVCAGWLLVALTAAALMSETFFNLHYGAAALPATVLLLVTGGRWIWQHPRLVPRALVWVLCGVYVLELPGVMYAARHEYERPAWAPRRVAIQRRLEAAGGKHLVIVRYAPTHSPHEEWVYNDADIEGSPVVWAREMDAARNRGLLAYYADRHAWLLEPDEPAPRLVPYLPRPASDVRPGH